MTAGRHRIALLILFALAACRSGGRADAGPAPAVDTPLPTDAGPAAPLAPDAGLREPTSDLPSRYVGFSDDETLFAYADYSEGAGYEILTVVESATGRRRTDFPLDSTAARTQAADYLEQHRFEMGSKALENPLSDDERIGVRVQDGTIEVRLWKGEADVRLAPPAAFAESSKHFRSPAAKVWGFSPKGTYAAIRLVQEEAQGTDVTYWVVNVAKGREALRGRTP